VWYALGCIRLTSGFHFVAVLYPVIGGSVPFWRLVKNWLSRKKRVAKLKGVSCRDVEGEKLNTE